MLSSCCMLAWSPKCPRLVEFACLDSCRWGAEFWWDYQTTWMVRKSNIQLSTRQGLVRADCVCHMLSWMGIRKIEICELCQEVLCSFGICAKDNKARCVGMCTWYPDTNLQLFFWLMMTNHVWAGMVKEWCKTHSCLSRLCPTSQQLISSFTISAYYSRPRLWNSLHSTTTKPSLTYDTICWSCCDTQAYYYFANAGFL